MKKITFLILLFLSIISLGCPKIKGILIDACGTREETNEWMVLTTDVSISLNSLKIDFDINNNSGGSVNGDINIGGCPWETPRTSSIDSLKVNSLYNSNIISISPGGTIPANSTILVLTSDSLTFPYDITNLTQYGNVYVVQSSCKRNTGAFTNLGNGANYRITKVIYNSCRDSVWHYIGNSAVNGQYGVRTRDTMRISYSNILTSACNYYAILPIEIASFMITCNNIEFITESEYNVKMFYIEVLRDGTWIDYDSLLPTNTVSRKTYFLDRDNESGYFRLKVLYLDNSVMYFNIYYISCNLSHEDYVIYNLLGQKIEGVLPPGLYIKSYRNKSVKILVK